MSNDLKADLTAELLGDHGRPAPLPPEPEPAPSPPSRSSRPTPAVTLTVTPLRWSWPAVEPSEHGRGLAVRLGAVRVELVL